MSVAVGTEPTSYAEFSSLTPRVRIAGDQPPRGLAFYPSPQLVLTNNPLAPPVGSRYELELLSPMEAVSVNVTQRAK
jgi:hypothetical protein